MNQTTEIANLDTIWKRLRQSAAQAPLWLELARAYAAAGLPWQAAYAARQSIRMDAALLPKVQKLNIRSWQDATAGDALLGRARLSDAAVLAERFASQVSGSPGDWLTWLYLARLREMSSPGATEIVQHAIEQARRLEPVPGETLHWMGVWRLNGGDAAGAVAALSGLLDIRPVRYGSMMYLGEALLRVGNIAAAEKAFTRASLSSNPEFLLSLSARVYAHNYWQEALGVLEKALGLQPNHTKILLAMAKIQSEVYLLAECRESLRRLYEIDPGNREANLLRAGLQGRMGDARGHLATLQAAYDVDGDPLSRLASSVAMTSLYNDLLAPDAMMALHRRVCRPIEEAVARTTTFANDRTTSRRLRVGMVSGDFHRQHPVNIFMLPVLLKLDPQQLEVFIYHTGTMFDEYTRQAQACATGWREAAALDDPALQKQILEDRIDILIDLAGHTATHRLGVFALKAAPVQATFLGYPHSTGLGAIDWLIGDETVSPAEHAELFSEGIAQLPGSVFCWAPVDDYPLPTPRPADAPVVFGSFNNAMKLTPRTIALWAAVLKAVPHARLLLKAPSLRDREVCQRFAKLFAAEGIAPERIEFRGPTGLAEMMQEYGDVDIGLDPMPYNGGTTTLQALWMGVPVIALAGGNFVSRMGMSFLKALGQPDWVAADDPGYVEAAVRLAAQVSELRMQRPQLRAKMQSSPLTDINHYARNFEHLLRAMWDIYCKDSGERLILASSRTATPRKARKSAVLGAAKKKSRSGNNAKADK